MRAVYLFYASVMVSHNFQALGYNKNYHHWKVGAGQGPLVHVKIRGLAELQSGNLLPQNTCSFFLMMRADYAT